MIDKELLRSYSELKAKEKELQADIEELKDRILAMIEEEMVEKIESEFGVFEKCHRSKWIFSEKVKELEMEKQKLEAEEKANGTAKETKTVYLLYRFLT